MRLAEIALWSSWSFNFCVYFDISRGVKVAKVTRNQHIYLEYFIFIRLLNVIQSFVLVTHGEFKVNWENQSRCCGASEVFPVRQSPERAENDTLALNSSRPSNDFAFQLAQIIQFHYLSCYSIYSLSFPLTKIVSPSRSHTQRVQLKLHQEALINHVSKNSTVYMWKYIKKYKSLLYDLIFFSYLTLCGEYL